MASLNFNIICTSLIHILTTTASTEFTQFDCTWTHDNASFNLCEWQKTNNQQGNGYWEVYDDREDSYLNNYTYQFNVCADVANTNNLNNLCTNNTARSIQNIPTGYCTDILNNTQCKCLKTSPNGTTCIQQAIHTINISTAAYQMHRKKSNKYCYRLHDGITPPQFSLINTNDPTIGVSIKYIGGDWCPAFGKNREFVINFKCKDNYENVPDMDEKISEPGAEGVNGCGYMLEIDSTIGCPTQCQVINNRLCTGNGICEYDETNRVPRCFCFDGWYGEACDLDYDSPTHIELKHKDGKYIVFLIVIVGCMTILMLIIVYLVCRIYRAKKAGYGINAYIDEDMEESMQNTNIQQNKELKGSKLAEQLVQSGGNEETGHPIVV